MKSTKHRYNQSQKKYKVQKERKNAPYTEDIKRGKFKDKFLIQSLYLETLKIR